MTEQSSTRAIIVFDIDGVIRDVSGSYRRAIADTVEHFTDSAYRPTPVDIDKLKSEGIWNNDWEASQELIYRHFEALNKDRNQVQLDYQMIVAFFQSRYRGTDPNNLNGYICDEPLLLQPRYLEDLTKAGILWGFFSGATRASATYVLERRLGLKPSVLVAMEDAPSKPDPTGLFDTVRRLEAGLSNTSITVSSTVIYIGDTVADMYTVIKARELEPQREFIGVGVLPPHVQKTPSRREAYAELLINAGAEVVFCNVQDLTPARVAALL
ncbi:HAD family hydrolase [Calothrix sp. NIES-4071]|nr:HAD family hydrolase [Calothrix sp. NIES-4071]BAZ64073.1 HAD family hydrolase [Calothrix sp. NIES-4105]